MKMRKTSLNIPAKLWSEFRVQSLREGRKSQEILAELIAAYLRKKEARRERT